MKTELPTRKLLRLRGFDYSTAASYFVTICTRDRKQLLSKIHYDPSLASPCPSTSVGEGLAPPAHQQNSTTPIPPHLVGEGLAPPAHQQNSTTPFPPHLVGEGLAPPALQQNSATPFPPHLVGEGLAPPEFQTLLKPCGEIVQQQLLLLEQRFPSLTIGGYVIMPDHLHALLILRQDAGGASPSPTLSEIICAFKSLTVRLCRQKFGVERLFQRSYAEHIVRDKQDYETRLKYMYENPMRWYYAHRETK